MGAGPRPRNTLVPGVAIGVSAVMSDAVFYFKSVASAAVLGFVDVESDKFGGCPLFHSRYLFLCA